MTDQIDLDDLVEYLIQEADSYCLDDGDVTPDELASLSYDDGVDHGRVQMAREILDLVGKEWG